MKAYILSVCFAILIAPCAPAQSLPPAREEPVYTVLDGNVVGELVLDTTQRRILVDVEKKYQHDVDEVLANDTLSDEVEQRRLNELTAARRVRFKEVMGPERFARWERLTEAARLSENP